jgi:hypothetical protein
MKFSIHKYQNPEDMYQILIHFVVIVSKPSTQFRELEIILKGKKKKHKKKPTDIYILLNI